MILSIGVHVRNTEEMVYWLKNTNINIPHSIGFLTTNDLRLGNESNLETSEGTVLQGKYDGKDYLILRAEKTQPSLRNKFFNITHSFSDFYTFLNPDSFLVKIDQQILSMFNNVVGVLYSDILINNNLYLLDIFPTKIPNYIVSKNALRDVNGFNLSVSDIDEHLLKEISKNKLIYHVPDVMFMKIKGQQ